MNKIFNSVWNGARSCYVAVSEAMPSYAHVDNTTAAAKHGTFHTPLSALSFTTIVACGVLVTSSVRAEIFPNTTLDNATLGTTQSPYLVIGNIEDAFVKIPDDTPHELEEDNLGYKNVVGAQGGLYINSALTFTLVGGSEAVDLSDGPVWVTGVGQPSSSPLILITQLNLGSVNSASPTKGHISELNVGLLAIHGIFAAGAPAVVDVNNGVFKVGLLRNGSGVTIGSMGELTVESYSSIDSGDLKNNGVFRADNIASVNYFNSIDNQNVMAAGTMDWTGIFKNYGQADISELTLRGAGNGQLKSYGSLNAKGASLNVGTLTIAGNGLSGDGGNLPIRGSLQNDGTLVVSDTALVSGDLLNNGSMTVDALTIEVGGEVVNSADATLSAKHSITLNSVLTNQSTLNAAAPSLDTIASKLTVNGTFVNNGSLDAKAVESALVAGTLVNSGTAKFADVVIAEDAYFENSGTAEFADVSIAENAYFENNGTVNGKAVALAEGGSFANAGTSAWETISLTSGSVVNTGSLSVGELVFSGRILIGTGGTLKVDSAKLNGGHIVISRSSARSIAPEAYARTELNTQGEINTALFVNEDGDLGLGANSLDFAQSLGAPIGSGRLTLTQNVTTSAAGGIAVGNGVWRNEDSHADVANGSLVFAAGSTTVIDASILTDGKSAFSTSSESATATIDPSAVLILGNVQALGEYTILTGFDVTANGSGTEWTGGWTGDNLYALAQDGTGINWSLELHNDANRVWVTSTLDDVVTVYPDLIVPNITNSELRHSDTLFSYSVLKDRELSAEDKTHIINSVANIGFAGGAMSVSMNDLTTAADSIEGRVSMKNESFTEDGLMREWDRGSNLWIDAVGGKQKYKSLSATGISKAGYDTNSYGFVMGYDYKLADKSVIIGGALSFTHGSLDSTGSVIKTKNKYDSFGLHLYGAYAPIERVNLIGSISWMHNSFDITQSIGAAGFSKADADVKSNLFSLAARAEMTLPVGKANVVPHAGLRYVWAKSGSFDTKVDGKKVWSSSTDAVNAFQIPVGAAVRADIAAANGWNIRPQADVTLIPQLGDSKSKATLTNAYGASDTVNGEFSGKFGTNVTLGVQADKGMATIGARYGFTGGTKGKADHAFKIEARLRF